MLSAVVDYIFVAVIAVVSGAVGFAIRSAFSRSRSPAKPDPSAAEEKLLAKEMLARLNQLANSVAANVGEHNSQVKAISDELNSSDKTQDQVVDSVARLLEANEKMQAQLHEAEQRLEQQAQEIEDHATAANTDALTGLPNRRAFDREMGERYDQLKESGTATCVLMIDVDHFKKFNDTHGHQAGDEVLRGVADVLRKTVGKSGMPARYGGEEFSVVFAGLDAGRAKPHVESIRAAIEAATFQFEGKQLKVTASLGLAQLTSGENFELTIKRADDALYQAKEAGRNAGYWHDGDKIHPIVEAVEERVAAKTERLKSAQAAAKSARQDPAASLPDRSSFQRDVKRRLSEWKRNGAPMAVVLVQVDSYAKIVARHGQSVGEMVVAALMQFLTATMREMDYVARYDNETFGLMLPGAKLLDAVRVAERLRRAIANCPLPLDDGEELRFTVSLGVAEPAIGDDVQKLLQRSEAARDSASGAGRNRTAFHNGEKCHIVSPDGATTAAATAAASE